MERLIVHIYNYLEANPWLRRISLLGSCFCMLLGIFTLSYREDIEDFLPLDSEERENLDIFQQVSGAGELVVLFDNQKGSDTTIAAIEEFTERIKSTDSCHWTKGMISYIDEGAIAEVIDEVYNNIPYFLTDSDYHRMDSLLSEPDYLDKRLTEDRNILQYPTGGFAEQNIARDPLGLFMPVLQNLQSLQRESHFKQIDGYIFTPDRKHAIVLIPSPFGNSETEQNSRLLELVDNAIDSTATDYPSVHAHVTGGPAIAVSNASRIKQDSILTISLATTLIIALLVYSFRSARNIALTAITILWGCMFALAGMSVFHSQVSLIVLGISSVVIGIAFNYPLHLINHLTNTYDIRKALREIAKPLLIGNITTIGAFLALVPLKSTALRDLGIFASLLLLGTILFVLIYLPHMVKPNTSSAAPKTRIIDWIAHLQPEKSRTLVIATCILSVILGIVAFGTRFDPIISHINYMTREQRTDMEYFQSITTPEATDGITTIYLASAASTVDKALEDNEQHTHIVDSLSGKGIIKAHIGITGYIPSRSLQKHRLERWNTFLEEHREVFAEQLPTTASRTGFTQDAFIDFYDIIGRKYPVQPFRHFSLLATTVFKQNLCRDNSTGKVYVVNMLYVPEDKVSLVEGLIPGTFDIQSVNSGMSNSISNDFNYIGWACSLIVFFFLWYSFRSLKLAIISFMPMALSWVWILGIMTLCGLKFNIVNIILATFIFGQGDDYTIFMTEGCLYEQKHHRQMLASYKNSIILSALIMFAGIGVLAIARHPALHSLGIITIVGMFCVVLMAYMIPPLMFNLINCYERRNI